MGFSEDFWSLYDEDRKKKKNRESATFTVQTTSKESELDDFSNEFWGLYDEGQKKLKDNDIAPVIGGGASETDKRKRELETNISELKDELGYNDSWIKQALSFGWLTDVVDGVTGVDSERTANKKQLAEWEAELAKLNGKEEKKKSTWFKGGAFEDGWQAGDLLKTAGATIADTAVGLVQGAGNTLEGINDLILHGVSKGADWVGADSVSDYLEKSANSNTVNSLADSIRNGFIEENTIYGDRGHGIPEAIGQILGLGKVSKTLQAFGWGAKAISAAVTTSMGASSMGSGISEAKNHGNELEEFAKQAVQDLDIAFDDGRLTKEEYDKKIAELDEALNGQLDEALRGNLTSDAEAWSFGAMKGVIDAGSELIFGGLGKSVNALGFNRGLSSLDDAFAKKLSSGLSKHITNKYAKRIVANGTEYIVKAGAEGLEEVMAAHSTALAKKLTYMSDEELSKLVKDEKALDQFLVSFVASAAMQGGGLVNSVKSDTDFVTGFTDNEQAVVNKEVERRIAEEEKRTGKKLSNEAKNEIQEAVEKDLDKGYISIDTIEEVLGGDSYKSYQDTVKSEDALKSEFDELKKVKTNDATLEQNDRYNELKKKLDELETTSERDFLQRKYKNEAYEIAKSDRLIESYNERARRGEAFTADLSKYDKKQQDVILKAIDSGILNNTNRTHEFVDMVAKISADKGVLFDFTNNEKLKNSGFAVDGKTVNGYVTKDGITVNIQSNKSLNSVVGHEIAHVLEGTELYTELQKAITEYAKSKGDYQGRFDTLSKLYENIKGADVNAEITADLVGDYLFTDADFISNLSVKHRNVFQKIYDEIKYLYKVATAGTKEARELEKVKRAFEEAYRAQGKTQGDTKYSITESFTDSDGNSYDDAVLLDTDFFDGISPRNWGEKLQEEVNRRADEDPFILPIVDENGNTTVLQFAGSGERVTKDGKSNHTVNDKLSFTSDNVSKLAVVHIDEVISVSEENNPYYTNENNHQWLDKNGWLHRNANVINSKNGNIYNLTVDIAKTADGRTILYATNGKIKKVGNVQVDSLKIKGPGQNSNSGGIVSQKGENVNRKFSLSKAVEETNDLMALHNLKGTELLKSLELGGLPMPSIAIIKAEANHDQYGEISLILPKETIDPKANKDNKIYGADAWTPTYPKIEFKPNEAVEKKISDKYYELHRKYGSEDARPLYKYTYDLERVLNNYGGEAAMLEDLYNSTNLMRAYLLDTGKGKVETIQKEVRTELSDAEVEMNEFFINELGADVVDGVMARGADSPSEHRIKYWKEHGDKIKEAYSKLLSEEYGFTAEQIENVLSGMKTYDYLKFIRDAHLYRINGRVTTKTEADNEATENAIKEAAGEGYKAWVDSLFKGIEEKSGIRNNVDYFTNSGNRRKWEALHWENTLENVVRVMKQQNQTGADAIFGAHQIFATAAKNYGSIDEVKADSHRLYKMSEEEYEAIKDSYSQRMLDIANRIMDKGERNQFIALDNAMECIVDAVRKSKTKAGIYKEMKQYQQLNVTEQDVEDIVSLVTNISNMPTGYFESKPMRAVGFDEVGVFVIPNNADVKLKQELLNRGYAIAEYDPDVEGSRQKVVNSFEQYKFSLSEVGAAPREYGRYNVYGKDIAYEGAAEDVAPIRDDIAPGRTVASAEGEILPDDYAPMTEEDAAMIENEALDSITDADAPPEVDTPYDVQRDTGTIENKPLKKISERASEYLGLNRNEKATLEGIVQNYSQNESLDRDYLYSQIRDNFSVREEIVPNEDVRQMKKDIKSMNLFVSDEVKSDFGKSKEDGYTKFLRSNFGKLRIVKDAANGIEVDSAYEELSSLYPSYFPEDIINPADRLRTIADVASMSSEDVFPIEVSEAEIQEVADMVYIGVSEYMNEARLSAAEASVAPHSDTDAPLIESDIETENKVLSVREMYDQKKQNYRDSLAALEAGKEKSLASFNEAIGKKLDEYNALKNKNTKRANTLLQQIENLRLRRDNVQGDYTNRIAKQQVRLENFESKDFSEFENKVLAVRRKDIHGKIIEEAKAQYEAQGFDLDEVLKGAKDLSTFATVDNTPQRVMEKSLGYKAGQILSDITVNKVAQNETEGIKWLNTITDRKNGLIAQLVKQYGIKPRSKESAAAQMYAEGFYVDKYNDIIKYGDTELEKDFPDEKVRENIKALSKDQRIRQFYDETLDKINESRARNAYPEIQKLENYFLHFRAMEDTFSRLGLPFNPNDIRAKDLPTDLNGVTADLKPGQPYFASAKHREGKRTSFDLLGGLEKYATSAKNQIYHIDDIQTLRAVRNYIADTYGQAKGLSDLDALSEEEVQERIKEVYGAHLSTFAKFLNEEANVLAGKTALIDRGFEGVFGRRAMTFMNTVNRQVGSNQVGYNVSSALTNFLAPVQAFAKTNKADFIKGFAQTVSNRISGIYGKGDGFADESPVVIRRKGAEQYYRTAWQKLSDPGYALAGAVDNFSTELIARAKYNELTRKGMDSETAHVETDKWVSRLMGDRSLGQMPHLYNSKVLGLLTKYQLEVRNQLDSQFYDTIKETNASTEDIENGLHRNAKRAAKIASTFFTLAVGQHIFGKAFESIAGYNPAFDIISVLIKTFGLDDEEESEDTFLDNIEQGFFELMGDMPYTSILEGGRIPMSAALPVEELYKGEDQYGNKVHENPILARIITAGKALPYYLSPGGYGQAKKTIQGLGMFDEEHPISGSYTDSGKLRFPVEDNFINRVQAGIFGQYASPNARDYFDNERKALDGKQIQEFIDSGISIQDYWKYREGLSGLKTLNEKADYISSLDLPIEVKNLLINNLSGRKEPIDLSGMDGYADFNEYDFAQKNPEKYEWLKGNGITVEEYEGFDEETKEEYDFAFKYPEKYTMAKSVGGYRSYRTYASDLYDIKADKDEDGKSISGSRKNKVIDYISNLDIEYGEKIILFKSEYPADDTYNYEIIDYLNGRADISYEDMVTILKELGFKIGSDGVTVTWD